MGHPSTRYDTVSMLLHWTIGVGILLVGATELARHELLPKSSALRATLKAFHEPAGAVLFALIALRLLWRAAHRPPEMPNDAGPWSKAAAQLMHFALYAVMIAVPVLGLAMAGARSRPIDFGAWQLVVPPFLGAGRDAAKLLKEVHEIVAQTMLALALLHAAAALWHHHVLRDQTLRRMLPARPYGWWSSSRWRDLG